MSRYNSHIQNSALELCVSKGYNPRIQSQENFMEINYQETSKDLLVRIDTHAKYGAANIDQWTVDLLKP